MDRFHRRTFAHLREARKIAKPAPPGRDWLSDFLAPEAKPKKPSKHTRIKQEHRHLHLTTELRAKATERREMAPLDPELAKVVSLCQRGLNPRTKRDAPLPADAQPKAWRLARDAFAAKNYDLCHRAAAKQWERNRHLEREVVPCVFCPGKTCARCRGRKQYRCQPDLERLAFLGLLEAIRLFDPEKAHCISSYAVWTMKHQMMTLLRQTPVFYPQDLLRDRREVAALRKKLGREPTEIEAEGALKGKNLNERALLALNCYYGNERKSVEELHERYVQRTERGEDKRQRKGRVASVVEVLCCEQPRAKDDSELDELRTAIHALPTQSRAEVERFVRGRGTVSESTLNVLREAML